MTALDTDDLAVITGPLEWNNGLPGSGTNVALFEGEVVRVEIPEDQWGTVLAYGFESRNKQFINASSLTPLSAVEVISAAVSHWGDLLDPNYVHDYVWDGDYEGGGL